MYYIRFTSDIKRDIKAKFSKDFRTGKKLQGLCAWKILEDLSPYASDEEIIEAGIKTAKYIAKHTYGGYSSENSYAIIKGTYVGSANDGVCIKIDEVITCKTL